VIVRSLGRVEYAPAWRLQDELAELRAHGRMGDTLLLLEHPPTLTLGRSADRRHLLASTERLESLGFSVHEVDRGGDVTYHGPGQLVGYPIIDLSMHRKDLHWFLREIEAAIIDCLAEIGLEGHRFPPHTGVWVGERKIAAIGVKVKRWVSTHGFALNVDPDLSHFDLIVPCGIRGYGVTSICKERHGSIELDALLAPAARALRRRFEIASDFCAGLPDGLSVESRHLWEQGTAL
jgi:lipoate-protein ligase B